MFRPGARLSLFFKYPIPEWVRPGLVVVYQHEGGTQSGESALYATGYRILIVTDVQNNVSYGIGITLLIHPTDYSIMFTSELNPVPVFVHPQEIQDALDNADVYEGTVVQGGRDIDNSIWIEIADNFSSTAVWISEDGLVKRYQFLERQNQGSGVVRGEYLTHFYIDWPDEDFPPVAQENHTYNIYSAAFGFMALQGSVSSEFLGVQGNIARYSATYSMGTAFPQKAELIGFPSIGPFYIHPDLLKRDVVLEIPDIGFVWQNEPGSYGVDSVIYFNGQECYRASCYENGLAAEIKTVQMGLVIVQQLVE